MKNLEKYKSKDEMPEQELEEITKDFIQAKFNQEQKIAWANQLIEQHQIQKNQNAKIRKMPLRIIAIAASVLLVIALIPMLGLFRTSTSDLLAEYTIENPYPNKLIRKSTEADISEIRLEATEAYNQQQFAKAIERYQKLDLANDANLEDLLYLGLSQLYEKQSQNAIATLEKAKVASEEQQRFEQEINWFLALAYLQNKEEKAAKTLLETIVTENAWRAADAEILLGNIE